MQTQTIKTETPAKTAPAKATPARPVAPVPEVTPPIDVLESAESLRVEVDVPGVGPDALSLDLDKDQLTITAKRDGAPLEGPIVYVRTLVIPRDIDREKIEAKLDAGTLTLTLPRSASARPRQIPVRST